MLFQKKFLCHPVSLFSHPILFLFLRTPTPNSPLSSPLLSTSFSLPFLPFLCQGPSNVNSRCLASSDVKYKPDVFNNILGGDPNGQGSDLLSSITITPDYPDDNGDLSCDGETMAELRDWNTDSPKIVVCDPAGFGHGGIGKGYGTVTAVGCDSFDPRVSWKMETLGSILLHEYTHWPKLVAPPLSKETDDDAYGPYGVRQLDKNDATNNADSYSWFATENLWTIICQTDYQDPQPSDDQDPNCNGQVCKAPKSP